MDPMETPTQNGDSSSSQQLFEEARRRVDSQTPTHDSPSRQLLMEFSRMLIDSDRKFHNELDRASAEQEKKQLEALAAAAVEHERVRQSAERVAEKFRLQVEQERRRREEYEHRELDRIRQENTRIEAERRQRQLDEVKRKEEEQRRAAEEAKALEAAQERLRRQKAQEEADAAKRKAEQVERERKEREESAAAEAAAKAKAQQVAQAQQAPAPAVPNAIVNQLVSEAGVNIKAADPIGIIAVSILGYPQYCINQKVPLTDILLAKYHKCCGVLFGMYGPEGTERGRQRLGWRRIGTQWCSGQDHLERMTGLGAGWASLALRKIKVGSALVHPLPNAHYWRAFSRIVNTPTHEATATHYMVLKAMVEGDSLDRFVQCYGQAALAALRKGLIEFPRGHDSVAAKSMLGLVENFQKEKRITL
ncbi:putative gle1-like protein [Diplodia seriata]|uniref:mRNA export factor GLE1 n=1 Tax=Diplodia seriata TaxID=420778 RepID=A0A0G2GQE5_9PEZI|nr:putative gle1-like protein [Diplodia seriata]